MMGDNNNGGRSSVTKDYRHMIFNDTHDHHIISTATTMYPNSDDVTDVRDDDSAATITASGDVPN